MMKAVAILLTGFVLFACSENKPALTENEKNYLDTRDSLLKYRSDILELSTNDTSAVSDFIRLDYAAYKAKYKLSEKEMDVMRRTLNVRCEQVKAFKAIRENMSRSGAAYSRHSKDTVKGSYSFDQKLKPANLKQPASKDEEVEILMDAFEGK